MSKRHPPIKRGDIFNVAAGGTCTVIDYVGESEVFIKFNDAHGFEKRTWAHTLRSGKVKNPFAPTVLNKGYFGVGPHRASIDGKMTSAYKVWRNMMKRAYDESFHLIYPTYSDCSVCEEWHNFQNFAEWFEAQPNGKTRGFSIDKDLTVIGNKTYSPSACRFIPSSINTLLMDCGASRGDLPQGVYFDSRKQKYIAQVKKNGATKRIGAYGECSEARKAYALAKKSHIIDMANLHKNDLGETIYQNLISWKV